MNVRREDYELSNKTPRVLKPDYVPSKNERNLINTPMCSVESPFYILKAHMGK